MSRLILIILACALALLMLLRGGEPELPDGVLVPGTPQQTAVQAKTFEFDGHRVEVLAGFELDARVLGKERYWLDRESELSKYDLALGWGRMSDSRVLEQIDISQSGRWYRWRAERMPIPRREIERSSANMHLIPADDWIEKQIAKAGPGTLVRIKGYLVKVTSPDGWRWKSSLTRDDTGNGACELIFVEQFEIL
ncbi:hypothetical protein GCM10011348_00750 [Marinobacterium nitratireducens]|uniref:Uncharacterized protein n=1 Tax=Marinobacterium nitratireducens TaxID=518897 RepID=A0A918DNJ9_9GAMM|nr:hypothetical protein [Marinobacterium nitratireducens]GGO75595.1 hypothetical protein GCM10011348_00750 [Marinobacterium nitratireducens]